MTKVTYTPATEEDRERIDACVNACTGTHIEILQSGGTYQDLCDEIDRLHNVIDGMKRRQTVTERARAAIAKAKENES